MWKQYRTLQILWQVQGTSQDTGRGVSHQIPRWKSSLCIWRWSCSIWRHLSIQWQVWHMKSKWRLVHGSPWQTLPMWGLPHPDLWPGPQAIPWISSRPPVLVGSSYLIPQILFSLWKCYIRNLWSTLLVEGAVPVVFTNIDSGARPPGFKSSLYSVP